MLRALLGIMGHRSERVDVREPILLMGHYSMLSGIVADVEIGSPPQVLRVAIDVSTSISSLYCNAAICPPFIGGCYEPQASRSSTRGVHGYSDKVQLGGRNIGTVDFHIIAESPTGIGSSAFADVVGVIGVGGAGTDEGMLANKVWKFQETPVGLEITVTSHAPQGRGVLVNSNYHDSDKWMFRSLIELDVVPGDDDSVQLSQHVEFSPGEDDLVLPESVADRILKHLGPRYEVKQGRLVGPCWTRWNLKVTLLDSTGQAIAIPIDPGFMVHRRFLDASRRCSFRVRFYAFDTARIGRLLTISSAGGVYLNFPNRSIHASSRSLETLAWTLTSSVPLVPLFRAPDIIREGSLQFEGVAFSEEIPLYTLSNARQSFVSFGGVTGKGYLFNRVIGRGQSVIPTFSGSYTLFPLSDFAASLLDGEGGKVVFNLARSDLYSILLVVSNAKLVVIRIKARERLPFSPTRVLSRSDLEFQCPICLNGTDEGTLVEMLYVCGHSFHDQCVQAWREAQASDRRTPTCPICRNHESPNETPHTSFFDSALNPN